MAMATQTHAITVAQYEQSFEGYITIGWQGSADRQALSRRFKQSGQCTRYERTPAFGAEAGCGAGALPPHPQDFALWCLSRCGLCAGRQMKGGMAQHPPGSVEATESALGLLPSISLSSAQSGLILLRREKRRNLCGGFLNDHTQTWRKRVQLENHPPPKGATPH